MAPNTCRGLRPGSRDDIVSTSHIRHAHASDAHSPDAAHTRPVATPNLCPADRLGGARQPVRAVGARRSSTWWVDHEGEARLHACVLTSGGFSCRGWLVFFQDGVGGGGAAGAALGASWAGGGGFRAAGWGA